LFDSAVTRHLKRNWGKYALVGGGLTAAALGKEIEGTGVRKLLRATTRDDVESGIHLNSLGKAMQKYGQASTGGGIALGIKDQLDSEGSKEKKK
jgi:hypothetical protein